MSSRRHSGCPYWIAVDIPPSTRSTVKSRGSDQKVVYVNESLSILETTPSVSDPASLTVDS